MVSPNEAKLESGIDAEVEATDPRSHWTEQRWLRMAIVAMAAVALFTLGVAYLQLGAPPGVTTFLAVGGEQGRAGSPYALRVSARASEGRTVQSINLSDATVGGIPVRLRVTGDAPARVIVPIPEGSASPVEVAIRARADERETVLRFEIPVLPILPSRGDAEPDAKAPGGAAAFTVDVFPEDGVLALDMENRIFLWARNPEGAPLPSTTITVRHKSLPKGKKRVTTDRSGLAAFTLNANRPSFYLKIDATHEGETIAMEPLLRPFGRRMHLTPVSPIVGAGQDLRATLRTWSQDTAVFCDLLDPDGVWLDTTIVRTIRHEADVNFGPRQRGLHTIQCADHWVDPGETFATVPIIVGDGDAWRALTDEVRHRGWVHPAAFVRPETADEIARAEGFWVAMLRPHRVAPTILVSTRKSDLAAGAKERESTRMLLLGGIAGVFILILLFTFELVLRYRLATRARMAAVANDAVEAGIYDAVEMRKLVRAGRWRDRLMMLIVALTIVLNAVGILSLFALIR